MLTTERIHHVDLSAGLSPPGLLLEQAPAMLVFWWHTVPLGHHWVQSTELPVRGEIFRKAVHTACAAAVSEYAPGMTAADLTARTETWARAMEEAACPPCIEMPGASVVVATRDRPGQLVSCLQSLTMLRPPPAEVIVVDSAPQHHRAESIANTYGARYACLDQTGASAARNLGAQLSTQPILAFVDDDELLHPSWLARITAPLNTPEVTLVTGLVLPQGLETESAVLFEQRYSFIRGYRPRTFDTAYFQRRKMRGVPAWQLGGSGNMAVRRAPFLDLGGFDERLGAGRAGCSEDTELFYRVMAAGHACHYEPRAVAYHKHRGTREDLKAQLHLYMRGHVTSLLLQYRRYGHQGNLRQLTCDLPREYLKASVKSLLGRTGYDTDLLLAELSGYVAGMAYYYRHRHHIRRRSFPSALPAKEHSNSIDEALT